MKQGFNQLEKYDAYVERADLDAAFEKAQEVLSDPINPEDFIDIYGEGVASDQKYVEKFEKIYKEELERGSEFDKSAYKLGKIFEAIVFQHAELSNWFGQHATTVETSRYDDIKNGVDTIVEFDEDGNTNHLALAIDVTSSASTKDKFERIQSEIDHGHLAEIKYFVSDAMNIRGHKSNVPRVVVGANHETVYNVVNAWMEGDNKALADHPIQIKILSEISIQLASFRKYCETIKKHDLAEIYRKGQEIVDRIIAEKNFSRADMAGLDLDDVYRGIVMYAQSIAEANGATKE